MIPIQKFSYSKTKKSEQLINKYLGQSAVKRSMGSLNNIKKTPIKKYNESINEFTARFEKKIFCHLSAKEIEAIMNDNRRKIERQAQG